MRVSAGLRQRLVSVCGRTGMVLAAVAAGYPAQAQQSQSNLFPVPVIEGAVSWQELARATVRFKDGSTQVNVPDAIRALDGRMVKAVGFLLPLDTSGERQFLMEVSPHCPFCMPVGREGLIELSGDGPIGFLLRAVVVRGRFAIADPTDDGALYRMTNVELLDE